jgi:hypothetical protein
LLVSYCFALESAPSNKVGYVKLNVAGGTGNVYTVGIGLPFVFWDVPTGNVPTYGVESRKPSDILGTQLVCAASAITADRVLRQDNGDYSFRQSPSCIWQLALENNSEMEPGRAYQFRTTNQPNKSFVIAGEADTTAIGIPTVTINAGAYVPYSWRDPRELAVSRLNLHAQGFTGAAFSTLSDKVVEVGGQGLYAWYKSTDNTWQGMATVIPGKSYYIASKHATPWAYHYNATGVSLTTPPTKGGDADIMKTISKPVQKTTKAVVKTTTSTK